MWNGGRWRCFSARQRTDWYLTGTRSAHRRGSGGTGCGCRWPICLRVLAAVKPCPSKMAMLIFTAISRKNGFVSSTSVGRGTLALSRLWLRCDPIPVCYDGLPAVIADHKRRNSAKVVQGMVIYIDPPRIFCRKHPLCVYVL